MRPSVVIAISDAEYDTKTVLPPLAQRIFADRLGLRVTLLQGKDNTIPGLANALRSADLLVLGVRRKALPEGDLAALKKNTWRRGCADRPAVGEPCV